MRVLVCGGRDFNCVTDAFNSLSQLFDEIGEPDLIIHGGANGADSIAGEYAHVNKIRCQTFLANWKRDGKAAGPIRNQRMLAEGKPDLVVAFPGGKGTADMVRRATSAGVPVRLVAG